MNDFETVWQNIISNRNKMFFTQKDHMFTYLMDGDYVKPMVNGRFKGKKISKTEFKKALGFGTLSGDKFNRTFTNPVYLRGILKDKRIIGESGYIEKPDDSTK